MARYPCDASGHRYPGAQRTVYVAAYTSAGKTNWFARLCREHYSQTALKVSEATTDWAAPSLDEPIHCPVCHVLEADGYFVATLYDGDEPIKRAGCVCPGCVEGLPVALCVAADLVHARE